MNILLVEDHRALAEVSCKLLSGIYGHTVDLARNGADALVATRRSTPDLVLVDLGLPDMEGYELAARLRSDPKLEETILVALTGVGNVIDEARASAVGFDAHYTKPMDFGVLGSLSRRRPATATTRIAVKDGS